MLAFVKGAGIGLTGGKGFVESFTIQDEILEVPGQAPDDGAWLAGSLGGRLGALLGTMRLGHQPNGAEQGSVGLGRAILIRHFDPC